MNLTKTQQDALRYLVEGARAGKWPEDDIWILTNKSFTSIGDERVNFSVSNQTVVALASEDYVHATAINSGWRIGLTRKAYDTVDSNFASGSRSGTTPSRFGEPENGGELMVFVCHSHHDSDLASLLVELIQAAFRLNPDDIRCTSVSGYKLPSGISTDERLRTEVRASTAFIGLVTPNSRASEYVLFELGGRWGSRKPLFPLLGGGLEEKDLKRPLSSLNPLNCSDAGDLHQLVTDLGKCLNVVPDKPSVYQKYIEKILDYERTHKVSEATVRLSKRGETPTPENYDRLSEDEEKILLLLTKVSDYHDGAIAHSIGVNVIRTRVYLDRLLDRELIHDSIVIGDAPRFQLTREGRAYLVKWDLV